MSEPREGVAPAGRVDVPGRLELSAPADPETMDLVHAVLEQLWAVHDDVSDRDRGRFETAVMEILGNIIEHAYQLDDGAEATTGGRPAPLRHRAGGDRRRARGVVRRQRDAGRPST